MFLKLTIIYIFISLFFVCPFLSADSDSTDIMTSHNDSSFCILDRNSADGYVSIFSPALFLAESVKTDKADSNKNTDDSAKSDNRKENLFLHLSGTYILPVTYITLTILFKEAIYTETPENNPLLYINPVFTSIVTFGSAGFFAGLTIGLILSDNRGFMETFVYSTMIGLLLGITGMIAGSIYAMIDYDSIITNDLFYYLGPSMYLIIPVYDILRFFFGD